MKNVCDPMGFQTERLGVDIWEVIGNALSYELAICFYTVLWWANKSAMKSKYLFRPRAIGSKCIYSQFCFVDSAAWFYTVDETLWWNLWKCKYILKSKIERFRSVVIVLAEKMLFLIWVRCGCVFD